MKTVNAKALDKLGEKWKVECPGCGKELEYDGFFDYGELYTCECGCTFQVNKLYINENEYIES